MTKLRMLAAACSASALASVLIGAPTAWADGAAAEAQTPPPAPGDIIVTARKRQESILNVPVVETAIAQKTLERLQTQDLKDIATLVPGLAIGDSILSIGTQVSLRGVGTTAYDPGIDQSVSLNIDGLQLSQGLAYSSAFFDMAQVEVLEGPQALFYGKSSPGGVISVRTADPTNEFELIGRAGYESEASEKQGQIIVSGPVTDTLKLRLATQYDSQDGFYNNTAVALPGLGGLTPPQKHITPDEGYMIRGTALWNPTDRFSARVKLNQDYDKTLWAGSQQVVYCPGGLTPPVVPFINPTQKCGVSRDIPTVGMSPSAYPGVPDGGVPYISTTQTYGTVELNYKLRPDLILTSETAYYLLHSNSLYNTTGADDAGPLFGVTNAFHRRDITEEVRLNSDFSTPLNFTVGGLIERGRFTDAVNLIGNGALGAGPSVEAGTQTVDIETNSLFAQVRYKIIPKLELAVGARYTDETRKDGDTLLSVGGSPLFPVALAVPKIKADPVTPEATLTYKPTDDITVFGALKQGFKSGSFNVATPPTPGQDNAFGQEKVEGGEIGLKSRWLDRRLTFDIAGYNYHYKGLQVGAIIPVQNGIPVTSTINAGSALVTGVESQLAYRPPEIPGLNLHVAGDLNHAQFKSLAAVPCYGGQTISQGCNEVYSAAVNGGLGGYTATNESGLPLVRAPKWQVNFGFDYQRSVGHDMNVVLTSSTQYSSKYLTGLGYVYYQDAFFKTDMSVTLQGPRDRWEVALIGKNLNNALTTGNCTNENAVGGLIPGTEITGRATGGPTRDVVGCWMDRGREVWLRVTLRPFS